MPWAAEGQRGELQKHPPARGSLLGWRLPPRQSACSGLSGCRLACPQCCGAEWQQASGAQPSQFKLLRPQALAECMHPHCQPGKERRRACSSAAVLPRTERCCSPQPAAAKGPVAAAVHILQGVGENQLAAVLLRIRRREQGVGRGHLGGRKGSGTNLPGMPHLSQPTAAQRQQPSAASHHTALSWSCCLTPDPRSTTRLLSIVIFLEMRYEPAAEGKVGSCTVQRACRQSL